MRISISLKTNHALKPVAFMLNDSTEKTVFSAKWLFKVMCFDEDEKPLGTTY